MLSSIKSVDALARALGMISEKHLSQRVASVPVTRRYKHYRIPKASGYREIMEPHPELMEIQMKLMAFLAACYVPPTGAHGYIKGRSILTNARTHVRQPFVLNIDLQDFFHSCTFGRIKRTLMGKRHGANATVAEAIAKICCFRNSLPEGSPTSSVLSNLICEAMDAEFSKLADAYDCKYSRYSDDITFSCGHSSFPTEVATIFRKGAQRRIILGDRLRAIVRKYGFEINEKKTRLLSNSDRQKVTGLVVNEIVNVERTYIRNIRATLHDWEKQGLEISARRFEREFCDRKLEKRHFLKVVWGKISYVGLVKGYQNEIYLKLKGKFESLENRDQSSLDAYIADKTYLDS